MAKENPDLSKLSPIIFNGMPLVNLSLLTGLQFRLNRLYPRLASWAIDPAPPKRGLRGVQQGCRMHGCHTHPPISNVPRAFHRASSFAGMTVAAGLS